MYDSPRSLQEECVLSICDSLSQARPDAAESHSDCVRMLFHDGDIFIPGDVSERLLQGLSEQGQLEDHILQLFDSRVTRLQRVCLRNVKAVTATGLRALHGHRITNLEATGLEKVTVNQMLCCLGDWTLQNLRTLNVSRSVLANASSNLCMLFAFSSLRSLTWLNVSNTNFNRHALDMITQDLPHLEGLDISCTKVHNISSLHRCPRLVWLNLYNLRCRTSEEAISVVCELSELRHLDISDDQDSNPIDVLSPMRCRTSELLQRRMALPLLQSLDISGKDDVEPSLLREFVDSHPQLCFLGLVQTGVCADDMFVQKSSPSYRPNLVVTGNSTETQVIESLRRYMPRQYYIQKALFYLFRYANFFSNPQMDVIELVLEAMKAHPSQLGIQMAATACLYNLTKGDLSQQIHPSKLRKIVNMTLLAMETFPNHPQLQKNSLLTLCSDRILQHVTFDKFWCSRLVMNCLCEFEDSTISRMCVAICSILAAKISTVETSLLGAKPEYMQKLLSIVESKMKDVIVDVTMKFTLSALWNLTDESPSTCVVFLEHNGLDLYLNVLQNFPGDNSVETKVLGLVNNIAEVPGLRQSLMTNTFINKLRELLHSHHIDVSYFAAGIISHLACDGMSLWNARCVTREEILKDLGDVVMSWQTPEGEMVAYRSFKPFFPLLTCHEAFQVQLWAVWAIHHVCHRSSDRYCNKLVDEGGVELLTKLRQNPFTNSAVSQWCASILDVVACKGNAR